MKNTFKRISILASAFLMALTSGFTTVNAGADTVKNVDLSSGYASETITLSDAVAIAGNCVMVKLSLNTGNTCMGYNLDIEFDSSLTLKSVQGAVSYCVIDNVVSIVNFTGTYFKDGEELTTLIFETPENAAEGTEYSVGVKNVTNLAGTGDEEIKEVEVRNSTVEVAESAMDYILVNNRELDLRGDVNNDANIDLYDVIKITRKMMGAESLDNRSSARADVNEDGMVDLYDAIAICKYGMSADKSTAWQNILGR